MARNGILQQAKIRLQLLESNMRLKLSGPDYKDQDPVVALADFKKRVSMYESAYVPLGEYEEANDMPYVQVLFAKAELESQLAKVIVVDD